MGSTRVRKVVHYDLDHPLPQSLEVRQKAEDPDRRTSSWCPTPLKLKGAGENVQNKDTVGWD